jgi:hypothetical protein
MVVHEAIEVLASGGNAAPALVDALALLIFGSKWASSLCLQSLQLS